MEEFVGGLCSSLLCGLVALRSASGHNPQIHQLTNSPILRHFTLTHQSNKNKFNLFFFVDGEVSGAESPPQEQQPQSAHSTKQIKLIFNLFCLLVAAGLDCSLGRQGRNQANQSNQFILKELNWNWFCFDWWPGGKANTPLFPFKNKNKFYFFTSLAGCFL